MFVRIRGKGACPENSQAAVMHIRGFRHTHSSAPPDSFYPLLHTAAATAGEAAGAPSNPPPVPPSSSASPSPSRVEMRPFRFALFPVGIHAAALTQAQAKWMDPPATVENAEKAAEATAAPASPLTLLDSEVARMVWKETWNLYDILYDEVPLLPWTEAQSGAAAVALAETVEAQLGRLATAAAAPDSLTSLAATTDDFELASQRGGSRQVVVCPHYYAAAALPEDAFKRIQQDTKTTEVARAGPVVVLDLTDLPVAQAGGKAMVNVAWCTAFAAMQPDSALLRCRAVVVRLPYAVVPTYEQAAAAAAADPAASPTLADAVMELVDFVGEHITAVRHAMVQELAKVAPAVAAAHAAAPPVLVVGREPAAMSAALQSLLSPSADAAKSVESSSVVVFYGDHLAVHADGSAVAAHELGTAKAAAYVSIGEASACAASVETVLVPLRALLEGGEEPWDEYTLRERQRLNFCPCCGDCGAEAESDGADHGHSHGGHGHGHHH